MAESTHALTALRAGTSDLHQALESTPVFARLLAPNATVGDYAHGLTVFQHGYAAFETELEQKLQQYTPAYSYIARLPLLNDDLSKLGANISQNPAIELINLQNKPGMLGVLYVVEGSALGTKVLMKRMQAGLATAIAGATAYYRLGGKIDNHDWPATQSLLRENLTSADEIEQAVASARRIFSLFIDNANYVYEHAAQ